MKKHAVLIGSFHRARSLSSSLLKKGYHVTVIYHDIEKCKILAENLHLHVICGDETKPFILEDANVYDADLAVTMTSRDEDNLVICQLCKKKFRVKKAISVLNDPTKASFFYKMGIDSVVCEVNAVTSIIEQQAFYEGIARKIPTGEGQVSIAEVPILEEAPSVGKPLWALQLPKEVIIGCVVRGEACLIPRGDTCVLAGDKLIVISSYTQEAKAIQTLTGKL